VLVLCPGKSLAEYSAQVTKYIDTYHPFIISVNFASDKFPINCIYIGSNRRYSQLSALLGNSDNCDVIAASNVISNSTLVPKYMFSYPALVEQAQSENSAIVLINLLCSLGVKEVAIAGFDGYKDGINNYFVESVAFCNAIADNEPIARGLTHIVENHNVALQWITPSAFDSITG
jgi:4-hydroxy 2-oxovalerate aldolase